MFYWCDNYQNINWKYESHKTLCSQWDTVVYPANYNYDGS